jgi:hypothetical protein
MTEAEWLTTDSAPGMLTCVGPFSARKHLLYGCVCCRWVWAELAPERRAAVELLEGHADGAASRDECQRAAVVARAAPPIEGEDKYSRSMVDMALRLTSERAVQSLESSLAGLFANNTPDEQMAQASWMRDIFGNPFRPVAFSPTWRTDTAVTLARQMYDAREFSAMPILADALQDAGCDSDEVLTHCRGVGPHVRGCWVVDLVLGKQ